MATETYARQINKIFRKDCAFLSIGIFAAWLTLIYAVFDVTQITNDFAIKATLVSISVMLSISLGWGFLVVFKHIRKNKKAIYTEEISNYEKAA